MTIDAVRDQPGVGSAHRQPAGAQDRVQDRVETRHAVDLPALRQRTCDLLHQHVPLTLLLDLVEPHGPDSARRFVLEGGDVGWLRRGAGPDVRLDPVRPAVAGH